MNRITIAMVAHNEEHRLQRVLNSILRQSVSPAQLQILVVDNASTDNTVRMAIETLKAQNIAGWQVLRLKENHMGRARAAAVDASLTEWVAFLDADCLPHEDWLRSSLERALSLEKDVAAISLPIRYVSGSTLLSQAKARFSSLRVATLFSPQASAPVGLYRQVDHVPTACALFRRDAVLAAGNFSNEFARACEDVDMCVRLRRHGYRIIQLNGPYVEHHQTDSWFGWLARMWRYGSQQVRAHGLRPKNWPLRFFAVATFFPLLVALGVGAPWALVGTLAVYVAVYLWPLNGSINLKLSLAAAILALLTHAVYSLAFLKGFLARLLDRSAARLRQAVP